MTEETTQIANRRALASEAAQILGELEAEHQEQPSGPVEVEVAVPAVAHSGPCERARQSRGIANWL